MNAEEFEKRMQRVTLRQPATELREDILKAARQNIKRETQIEDSLFTALRKLLARIPAAWTAVAAVWLVIIGANSLLFESSPAGAPGGFVAASSDGPTIWNLQRAEMSQLVDHFNAVSEPLERPPKTAPTPRSDRRREDGLGDFQAQSNLTTFA